MLNDRSLNILLPVHPDLKTVVLFAHTLSKCDFIVTEGLRSVSKQSRLVKAGASRTLSSRHITGHAVDVAAIVDGQIRWDWPLYHIIADAFFTASASLSIPIEWGGNWKNFPDGPHFQLPRA